MSIDFPQHEADRLLAIPKHAEQERLVFPGGAGGKLTIHLHSDDRHEEFLMDVTRASIRLTKATLQHRARVAVILVRIDLDGPPHRNPDGAEIPCPHIHLYREGYGDKWASLLPPWVTDPSDPWRTFHELMLFCNVVTAPNLEREFFT